jgi:CheY-like chemotaxis protein
MTQSRQKTCGKTPDGSDRLVLVVDGDAHHRSYHTMILRRFEFRAIAAATAREALEAIAAARPSLVLTELDLPDMNGFDLLRRLCRDPSAAAVPVVALYANGDNGTESRCLKEGFAACLKAPAAAEELFRTVHASLEGRPRQSRRVHTKMPVIVNDVPLDCVEGECASVISEHGMYIRTLKPHPPNSRLTVRIDLYGRSIAAEAVVLYSHRFGEGPFGEPGMGIKFDRIGLQDQEFLRLYIDSARLSWQHHSGLL